MLIGCHLSAADGFRGLVRDALFVGANVFQFFTRNPRGGAAKPIDPADVADYLATAREHAFGPILAHAPYTLNPCSAKPETREFARDVFADDLSRMEFVPGNLYNFHPGSHVGQGVEAGIGQIVETLDAVLRPEQTTTVLLETMSGKGSEVGGRFEELRAILDRVGLSDKMGVCLDTCHVSDAGYDLIGDLGRPRPPARDPPQRQQEPARRPQGPPRVHRRGEHRARRARARRPPSPPARPAVLSGDAAGRTLRLARRDRPPAQGRRDRLAGLREAPVICRA